MSGALLDVNVLVALMWPDHDFHEVVQAWFGQNARKGWASCPITQAGFVGLFRLGRLHARTRSGHWANAVELISQRP
jgi:predicted nucleic acid-binding protein